MDQQITCLGKIFTTEDERREFFRDELRKLLPKLKNVDGFPIGEDEDIIALSDPPYFTACPNPWLTDFILEWEQEKIELEKNGIRTPDKKVSIPYAADVSEGKNNPIYNAHSYHTKVPHPVIMRYILHYTQPGDIVFDGFAGTGMTGVAAQLCGNPDNETKYKIDNEFKNFGNIKPIWGGRKVICGDLSPIASFIAYNYNTPIDISEFDHQAKKIISEVERECGWMFETKDTYGNKGRINFIIWSDVFICPNCSGEMVFYNVAVDKKGGDIKENFNCPHCNATHTKKSVEKAITTYYDKILNKPVQQTKSVPVIINFSRQGKRYEKVPDSEDFALLEKIEKIHSDYWYPTDELPDGFNTRQPMESHNFTNVHHFHTQNNLIGLSAFWNKATNDRVGNGLKLAASAANPNFSKMRRFRADKKGGGPLAGTLYIASVITPQNCIISIQRNIEFVQKAFNIISNNRIKNSLIFTNSCTSINQPDNSVDYIFTDPPFGANIMYSELNFLWESWLRVKTNNKKEAIKNSVQGKSTLDYQNLMFECFKEYFRILKPEKWMTVEFSNTSAEIWNGIQTALQKAGFVIANVAALDKQQGSFKAVTTPTAVKQDLIISCYKPLNIFPDSMNSMPQKNIWDFITGHLQHLPIHLAKDKNTTLIVERSPKILYDRLISYYIVRGLSIPIDSKDFQEGLKQRFPERDGMYFTYDQVNEYETKKANAPNIVQISWQIATEAEGIEWLRRELQIKSLKYQDIHPKWMQAITAVRKGDILPELRHLLQQNFIEEPDGFWRVPNMNEAKDREALRNKILLREFNDYVEIILKAKKIKEVRVEALLAGFKKCWEEKKFETIVSLSEKIPKNILLEDEQLLMYYDIARDKV